MGRFRQRWLDLEVGHESNTTENHHSQLFHNNHDGTVTDVTKQVHLDCAMLVMGANFEVPTPIHVA